MSSDPHPSPEATSVGPRAQRAAQLRVALRHPATPLHLTLLMLALHGSSQRPLQLLLVSFAVLGLAWPRLLRQASFWITLTVPLVLAHVGNAYTTDNHKILLVWWLFALALHCVRHRAADLRAASHGLIGLCFLFATGWKLASPDFADGTFFTHCLLFDGRFESLTTHVAGMAKPAIARNAQLFGELVHERRAVAHLNCPPSVTKLATLMTVWTVFIEGLIALTFLASSRLRIPSHLKHAALVTFILSTYSIANVIGFGWLLAVMGFAACRADEDRARLAYLGCLFIMQTFLIPWSGVIATLLAYLGAS